MIIDRREDAIKCKVRLSWILYLTDLSHQNVPESTRDDIISNMISASGKDKIKKLLKNIILPWVIISWFYLN